MSRKSLTSAFLACLLVPHLFLIPSVLCTEEISVSVAECAAEDEEECSAMLQVRKNSSTTLPPPVVSHGNMIPPQEWTSWYDFVVGITIFKNGGASGCTGTVWGNKVLTAAHCGTSSDVFQVQTALSMVDVIQVERHPDYQEGGGAYDFLLLTLAQPFSNTMPVVLKSSPNQDGLQVMIAGMGVTAQSDINPEWPPRPVISDYMPKISCPSPWSYADCTGSGPDSQQASCGADSGGPWLYFQGHQAVVAGVNSFGYGGSCGDAGKMTGFMPTYRAQPWLDQVAPNHFVWGP